MSLVISRRSLIISTGVGTGLLVAAPMIARAASLMPLKGDLMDEWVVAFRGVCGETHESQFSTTFLRSPTAGAEMYAYSYNSKLSCKLDRNKVPLLMAMSRDVRTRVRQLNLIRPYAEIHYEALKKSELVRLP